MKDREYALMKDQDEALKKDHELQDKYWLRQSKTN